MQHKFSATQRNARFLPGCVFWVNKTSLQHKISKHLKNQHNFTATHQHTFQHHLYLCCTFLVWIKAFPQHKQEEKHFNATVFSRFLYCHVFFLYIQTSRNTNLTRNTLRCNTTPRNTSTAVFCLCNTLTSNKTSRMSPQHLSQHNATLEIH